MFTKVKTDQEIADIRISGQMLATILKTLEERVVIGMTTMANGAINSLPIYIIKRLNLLLIILSVY